MQDPKSPASIAPSSDDVVCYGTAFIVESGADWAHVEQPLPANRPQFGSAGFDSSFLSNCIRLLISIKSQPTEKWGDIVKQVAGMDHRSAIAVHVHACSASIRDLLATMTEDQAADLGAQLYRWRRGTTAAAHKDERQDRSVTIVKSLSILAKQARDSNLQLALRVEYRRRGNLS